LGVFQNEGEKNCRQLVQFSNSILVIRNAKTVEKISNTQNVEKKSTNVRRSMLIILCWTSAIHSKFCGERDVQTVT